MCVAMRSSVGTALGSVRGPFEGAVRVFWADLFLVVVD